MKNMIFTALFMVLYNSCIAQIKKKELFIFISEKPRFNMLNDTLQYQQYQINFENRHETKYKLIVTEEGNLKILAQIKDKEQKSLNLIYKNIKSSNNPIFVPQNQILNLLTYDNIIYHCDIDNFMKISKKFEIYIINDVNFSNKFYIAKKVYIETYNNL